MGTLSTLLVGAAISGITQLGKKAFPTINPLLWVALLAVVAGYVWSVFIPMLPDEIVQMMIEGFATSIAFYEVLKNVTPK